MHLTLIADFNRVNQAEVEDVHGDLGVKHASAGFDDGLVQRMIRTRRFDQRRAFQRFVLVHAHGKYPGFVDCLYKD